MEQIQYENGIYNMESSPPPMFGSPIPNVSALTSFPQSLLSVPQGIMAPVPIQTMRKNKSDTPSLNLNFVSLQESKINGDIESDSDELTLKRNLINAIDFETRKCSLQKLRLQQLHLHYKTKLKELASFNRVYKEQINILKPVKNEKELNKILNEKQMIRQKVLQQQQERINDEQKLATVTKENQKLTIIIHYLSRQLTNLVSQYQTLSKETNNNNNNSNCNHENDALNYSQNPQLMYDVTQAVQSNPWFHNIMEENRMIERHIRFLKHIIEEENRRTKVQELMLNQSRNVSKNSKNNVNNNTKNPSANIEKKDEENNDDIDIIEEDDDMKSPVILKEKPQRLNIKSKRHKNRKNVSVNIAKNEYINDKNGNYKNDNIESKFNDNIAT